MVFPANLTNLTVFRFSGKSLCITVPRGLQLRDVYIEATRSLEVFLEDPAALSQSLVCARSCMTSSEVLT